MPDYGLGQTNIDKKNGIRYGVISQHEVLQAWADSSEAYYGDPHCPGCGNDAIESGDDEEGILTDREGYKVSRGACGDFACDRCKIRFDADEAYGDEPISHFIDDEEYSAECGDSGDIFITKSPYYTFAPFCSPCAPGAGYLADAGKHDDSSGMKTYCFGRDWFDDEKCPYKYFDVKTGEEVK